MSGTRILFVDRDGVLLEEPADQQVDDFAKFRLVAGCVPALLRLRDAGFQFVMVSNQDGLGTASFPRAAFEGPQRLLLQVLQSQGIEFREVLVDEHFADDIHPNRKPGVGMVMHYLRDRGIDLAASAMVGDRETGMQFAQALGLRGLRFRTQRARPGLPDRVLAGTLEDNSRDRDPRDPAQEELAEVQRRPAVLARLGQQDGADVEVLRLDGGPVVDVRVQERHRHGVARGCAVPQACREGCPVVDEGVHLASHSHRHAHP